MTENADKARFYRPNEVPADVIRLLGEMETDFSSGYPVSDPEDFKLSFNSLCALPDRRRSVTRIYIETGRGTFYQEIKVDLDSFSCSVEQGRGGIVAVTCKDKKEISLFPASQLFLNENIIRIPPRGGLVYRDVLEACDGMGEMLRLMRLF